MPARSLKVMVSVITLFSVFMISDQAIAAASTDFYKGQTLTIIVPFGTGGGYDTWARLVGPYLKRALDLKRVKVMNEPGAGGLIGTNAIYHVKADGLTIGDTDAAGDIFAQMGHVAGVKFDVRKFDWIGRPDNDPHVIAVHADSPYKSFDDLIALKGTDQVIKPLATGKGSSDYNTALITYNAFGIPFHIIADFKGSHQAKATFISGQGTTVSVSASDVAELGSKVRVVAITSADRFAELPHVPTVVEDGQKHDIPKANLDALKIMGGIMSIGHAFVAPPGLPKARLAALRDAFRETVRSPGFRSQAKKAGLYVGYESGEGQARKAKDAIDHQAELTPFLTAQ